jgi:4-amino-4-deoxy-L-arabinose transferase-like glycosyltransferase
MPNWVDHRIKPLSQPQTLWLLCLGWLCAIAVVTLFWGIGDIGLIDETEPLFVEASRQMLVTGDWITPYFDNVTRFDKPPLIYWLMALSFKVFGINEWAARIPSAIAALAIVLLSFYTLQQHSPLLSPAKPSPSHHSQRPWLAAWLGATMLMLNLNTYFWGRTGYADMLLMTCMGGALLAFFLGYAQTKLSLQQRWYGAFYVLLALAILTKGPVAILLPALIIGGFTLYVGNLRQVLQEMQILRGMSIILLIALPWFILVTLANGEAFLGNFFGYHNLTRFSSVVNAHSGPWYFHCLVILVGFLPWSAYLPAAMFRTQPWQRKQWQQRSRSEQLGLYATIWFAVILGFFTVSVTKYFSYTLPLMPAAAILVGLLWIEDISEQSTLSIGDPPHRWNLSRGFNLALMGVMSWALFNCPGWLHSDPWMPKLGEKIAAAHIPAVGGTLWAIALVASILCILRRSNGLWLVNAIAFLFFIGVVLHPAVSIADRERQLPLRELAQTAVAERKANEELIMIGFRKPSLVFYTQKHVEYIEDPKQLQPYLKQSKLRTPFIITTPALLERTGLLPDRYQTLRQSSVYTLVQLKNKP